MTRYYEDLLAEGKISRPGWVTAKVSYGLVLDEGGEAAAGGSPSGRGEYRQEKETGSAEYEGAGPGEARRQYCPEFFSATTAATSWGRTARESRSERPIVFAAAKELHLKLLAEADSPAARAVKGFF